MVSGHSRPPGLTPSLGEGPGGARGSHLLLHGVLGLHIEQGAQVGQVEQGQGAQGPIQSPHPQRLWDPRNLQGPPKPLQGPPKSPRVHRFYP